MSGLRVVSGGLHSTIQDRGRYGYQAQGVPVAGVLDPVAMRLANALVGNGSDEAVIEACGLGPVLEVEARSVRVAVCGPVRMSVTRDGCGMALAEGRSYLLRRGDRLDLGPIVGAASAVLSVQGGLALDPVLGSLSTYVRAGIGPLGGRPLAPGDLLPLFHASAPAGDERALACPFPYGDGPLRVMLGPQAERFTDEAVASFLSGQFRVGRLADRVGLRLEGPALVHVDGAGIASDGLVCGSVQVPGNGQPIILLVDRQTVGGYAKIATVISADLARAGRLIPGMAVRFAAVDLGEAEAARADLERRLAMAEAGIADVGPDPGLDLAALYGANLVSGVVRAE